MKAFANFKAMLLVAAAILAWTPRLTAFEPLVTHVGLGTFLHPLQEPAPRLDDSAFAGKDHVYIFGVNGFNPMCLGNFNGLCDYLRKQGFVNTCFSQLYTCRGLTDKIHRIRMQDPDARIVLIGFSLGCNTVRNLANSLAQDGTPIDLLVYLVGDFVANTPESYPKNVRRVLNIRAKGLILVGGDLLFNGADIDGARNCRLATRHILVPSRKETLQTLLEELLTLALAPGNAPAAEVSPVPIGNLPTQHRNPLFTNTGHGNNPRGVAGGLQNMPGR